MLDIIKNIMKEKGLSQSDLVSVTGLKKAYISSFLSGRIENPTSDTLNKFAKALDVELSEFFPTEKKEVRGFIEIKGEVHKVTSFEDIRDLLRLR